MKNPFQKWGSSDHGVFTGGAQLFESHCLDTAIVELVSKGLLARIKGAKFEDFQREQTTIAGNAWKLRNRSNRAVI